MYVKDIFNNLLEILKKINKTDDATEGHFHCNSSFIKNVVAFLVYFLKGFLHGNFS